MIEIINKGVRGPAFIKRYHFPNGGILVTQPHVKKCRAIVPACPHVSFPVERGAVLRKLLAERAARKAGPPPT